MPPPSSRGDKPDMYMAPADDTFKTMTGPGTEPHAKQDDETPTSVLGYMDDCRKYVAQCITHIMGATEALSFLVLPCIQTFDAVYGIKTWRDLDVLVGQDIFKDSSYVALAASTSATRFRKRITKLA